MKRGLGIACGFVDIAVAARGLAHAHCGEFDAELAQEGSGKPHDPTIVVQKMPLQQTTPVVLTEALLQKSTAVILAWCYSNGYVT